MDLSAVQSIAESIVARAMAAGADAAEAYVQSGDVRKVHQFALQPPTLTEERVHGVLLRVWRGNCYGAAVGEGTHAKQLKTVAAHALAMASPCGVAEAAALPAGPLPTGSSPHSLGIVDPQYGSRAMPERVLLCKAILDTRGMAPNRLVLYQDSLMATAVSNSLGRTAAYARTDHLLCVVQNETGSVAEAIAGHRFDDLSPEALVSRATANLIDRGAPGLAPGQRVDVLLPALVGADLVRSLTVLFSADNVLSMVPILAEKVGKRIASPVLTIVDDPLLPGGLNTRPFDDEGALSEQTCLLADGILQGFLHRGSTAARMGMKPNGKALRTNLHRPLRTGPTNLYLKAGPFSPDNLREQLHRGLEVVGSSRRGSLNPATGEWSMIADGWWIENGRRVRQVAGVKLNCSLFHILRNISAVGNDLAFSALAGGAGSPTLLLKDLPVSR